MEKFNSVFGTYGDQFEVHCVKSKVFSMIIKIRKFQKNSIVMHVRN